MVVEIVDTRVAAVACLRKLGLERPSGVAVLLLAPDCRLVGAARLPPRPSGGSFDVPSLFEAVASAGAAGYVLVGRPTKDHDREIQEDIATAAARCRELDIHFVDYLELVGSKVRSLIWDRNAPGRRASSPWDAR